MSRLQSQLHLGRAVLRELALPVKPWRKPSALWFTSGMWRSFHPQPLTREEQRGLGHTKSHPVNYLTLSGLIIYFLLILAPHCLYSSLLMSAPVLSPAQEGRGGKGGDPGPIMPSPGLSALRGLPTSPEHVCWSTRLPSVKDL